MSQRDSRVQTEGVRYEIRGMLIYAVFEDGTDESLAVMSDWAIETGGAELVRRANLLPTMEAQLEAERQLKAEVVELLRTLSIDPESDGITRIRAFLAKVDAP